MSTPPDLQLDSQQKQAKLTLIKTRLQEVFAPTHLEVIDESDQHVGHAGHQGGARHFAIFITAAHFDGLSRVSAHREIYALFADLMPDQIHALRITVKNTRLA